VCALMPELGDSSRADGHAGFVGLGEPLMQRADCLASRIGLPSGFLLTGFLLSFLGRESRF